MAKASQYSASESIYSTTWILHLNCCKPSWENFFTAVQVFSSVALADTQEIFLRWSVLSLLCQLARHAFAPNNTTSKSAMGGRRMQKRGWVWSCLGFFNTRWRSAEEAERGKTWEFQRQEENYIEGLLWLTGTLHLKLWTLGREPQEKGGGRKSRQKLIETEKYIREMWEMHWGKRIGEMNMKETELERWNKRGRGRM